MTDSAISDISLEEKAALLEEENRALRKKIDHIQKMMDITVRHGDFVAGELEEKVEASERLRLLTETLEEKTARLEEENRKLKKKIERLKKTMDITTRHGDVVAGELEEKVEASIKEIEQHIRLISETIPVPLIIVRISDGKILYVNEHTCRVFGFGFDEFMERNAFELYENPNGRKIFMEKMSEQGRVSDFEVKMKKRDGSLLWVALFSQMMMFRSESCILTVIYDLTERKRAEEEIRRLNEKLDRKEEKYLIFRLDDTEYGIGILNVREIVTMIPTYSCSQCAALHKRSHQPQRQSDSGNGLTAQAGIESRSLHGSDMHYPDRDRRWERQRDERHYRGLRKRCVRNYEPRY